VFSIFDKLETRNLKPYFNFSRRTALKSAHNTARHKILSEEHRAATPVSRPALAADAVENNTNQRSFIHNTQSNYFSLNYTFFSSLLLFFLNSYLFWINFTHTEDTVVFINIQLAHWPCPPRLFRFDKQSSRHNL
jgi:hypothetical protein